MIPKKNASFFILFLTIGYSNSVSSQDQLTNKVMMGYQGWFLAPGDGATTSNPWNHWFKSGTTPDPANFTVDMWPDMSEYTEKFNTNMTYADGSNAQLFSSYSLSTTRKHFEWMSNYNVYGIYLQRFLSAVDLQTSGSFRAKNKVLENVIASAAEYNRKYAVMYDVSIDGNITDATMYAKIVADWEYLVDTYDILNKPEYVKQNGKPVVAIWGIGFKDRGLTTATSQAIINYFQTNAALKYRAYVMGGVPEGWRTRSGASETGVGWTDVYNSLDMISPWSVGRYSTNTGADSFKTNNIVPDLAACNTNNIDYMPVIWPGFSWRNLKNQTLNVTPRNGGQFYWRQAHNAVQANVKFIYVAMFDEVDEGTAMFKITETKAKLPIQAQDRLVSLDIDGFNLPSDWYLQLADQTQKMLDGTIPLTSVIPITAPGVDYYVKAGGNNNGGRTEADAFSTVDAAVAAAANGDRIYIVGAISQMSQVTLDKSLTFQGQDNAVISGVDGISAKLYLVNASVTISFTDITFKDSKNKTSNGAVFSLVAAATSSASVSFINCVFDNNSTTGAVQGGAIYTEIGTLNFTNCTFKNNISGRSGGAVYVNAASSPTVNITGCTFYNNLAQGTLGVDGGGAILSEGVVTTFPGQVTITNCTFFENKTTKDNVDYGAIRSTNTNVSVTNSLFYNNKITGGEGASSDFGSADGGVQSFTYSIGEWISSNVDTRSNFISYVNNTADPNEVAADLTASNLRFDPTLGKVIYSSVAAGIDSPIDFGSDGKDVGAWDYGLLFTTWTGGTSTDWTNTANWINGVPDATKDVVIETGTFQPTIASNVSVKSLTLNASTSLTVSSGNLTVVNELINNAGATAVVFENNANLIQGTATTVNANTGSVTVKRNSSTLKLLDYTLWSSPVANQNLLAFSPETMIDRFYNYSTTVNLYVAVPSPATTDFAVGSGYLIRMPNTASPSNPTAYPGVFTGVPNNGTIPVTLANGGAGMRFNLVGNPYPSPISMTQLVSDNSANITGTLYFWRKRNGVNGGAYCTWNNETFVTNNNSKSVDPLGIIQTGQGFFVEASSASTNLTFNNGQRVANNAGQFFKMKQVVENNRIWLNVVNATGDDFAQMAINYVTGATQSLDAFDAKYFNDGTIALNSVLDNADYAIQGRALPFDGTDEVPLSFKVTTAGTYSITIDHVDGLFSGNQDVILKDNATGAETNLKAGGYDFIAEAGANSSRFVLKYQKTLDTETPVFTKESVLIYTNKKIIHINSGGITMKNVQVFDMSGRLVLKKENINNSETTIDGSKFSHQVLIVKITSDENKVVSKKVVN
jgi:predicted outer membrane repeat protein